MKQLIQPLILGVGLLTVFTATATAASSLEGSNIGRKTKWGDAPAIVHPDQATRDQELKARQEAMAQDIARLQNRLKQTPPEKLQAALQKELEHIRDHHGWSDKLKHAFNLDSVKMALKNQDAIPQNFLDALIQFNKDMKARGIDLILLPPTPKSAYLTHKAVDGIDEHTEVWPGWTK